MSELYDEGDTNQYQHSVENYFRCMESYFKLFGNIKDLQEESKRPDLNSICRKQLNVMRSQTKTAGFKEIVGNTPSKYAYL
jgi:hypothetical protein